MTSTLAISLPPEEENKELLSQSAVWQKIINDIERSLDDKDITDHVRRFVELAVNGLSTREIANRLGVSPKTCKEWLVRYPELTEAIHYGQRELSKWRLGQIEKVFGDSIQLYQDILTGKKDEADPKILVVKQKTAKHIIDLLTGHGNPIRIEGPVLTNVNATLVATPDALNYLASQITGTEAPIEAVYRVVEDKKPAPLLNEDGNPFFGSPGILTQTDEGTLCHICGKYLQNLAAHISGSHRIKLSYYEELFAVTLPKGNRRGTRS